MDRFCRKEGCGVLLIVGENWAKYNVKSCNYICKECYNKYKNTYNQTESGKKSRKQYSQSEKGKKVQSKANKKYRNSEKGKNYRSERVLSGKDEETKRKYRQSDKGKQAQRKYKKSEKGKRDQKRYAQSEKGKITQRKYDRSEKGKRYHREYFEEQYNSNTIFKLHKNISSKIYRMLTKMGSSKQGESCEPYLDKIHNNNYEKELLRIIYLLFELPSNLTPDGKVWMTPENQGPYDPDTWIDDDYSTHTWQLDHIRPHSLTPYSSMDSDEFRKCWALENLRPLSAKDNIIEKDNRTDEQIEKIKQEIGIFLSILLDEKDND